MKHISLITVFFLSLTAAKAQTPKKPVVKPGATPVTVLKTMDDSASYAAGVSVANFYMQQGIKKFNSALVTRGINDVFGKKPRLLDDQACNSVMNSYMSRMQAEKSKPNIETGVKFLAANKTRPGVKSTGSGLQYEVLIEGNGERPTGADSVTCHYRGTLIDGTPVDNSYDRGQPITFALTGVIPGWTEGLQLMSVGSKFKFFIPYNLAYGAFDYNAIPGGSTLIFEVELLAVKKRQ